MKSDAETEIDERQKTLKAVLHYFYRDNAKSGLRMFEEAREEVWQEKQNSK